MGALPAGCLPLDSGQTRDLQSVVSGLSPSQLQWVSAYVAGLAAAGSQATTVAAAQSSIAERSNSGDGILTVLYGSQTGNSEEIAMALVERALTQGFAAEAISLANYKPANLRRESLVTFVISTHGEGDPPDDAELFHEYLMSRKVPELSRLTYSVLALGDSSYVNFCQTGREIDDRLHELGARSFAAMAECDLEYGDVAAEWTEQVIAGLPELLEAGEAAAAPLLHALQPAPVFDKSNPFPAAVLVNQKITGAASSKDVRHVELSLEGSGLTYEPGDSLAVVVENPPQLVKQLIAELGLDGSTVVAVRDEQMQLRDALTRVLEVTAVNLGFLKKWAVLAANDQLKSLLEANNSKELSKFVDRHQIIDVVREYPATVDASQFTGTLRGLSPRSYSISSSLDANMEEAHLTVAAVRYHAFGGEHWGAASTHIVDRLEEGDTVPVFVERNTRFRLPAADIPIVMIGAGTGVAPFRAFLERRVAQGSTGDNWLFFGDRNQGSDFLYQLEWQRYLKQGKLQRLDVAFSRDQRRKIYVQDRIRENGPELFRWIERGAVIYVCGDAKQMAGDINDALIEVLAGHGGLDPATAAQKLKELRAVGRYQRDVY